MSRFVQCIRNFFRRLRKNINDTISNWEGDWGKFVFNFHRFRSKIFFPPPLKKNAALFEFSDSLLKYIYINYPLSYCILLFVIIYIFFYRRIRHWKLFFRPSDWQSYTYPRYKETFAYGLVNFNRGGGGIFQIFVPPGRRCFFIPWRNSHFFFARVSNPSPTPDAALYFFSLFLF